MNNVDPKIHAVAAAPGFSLAKPISDYEDLNQALIDAFFCEVMNSTDPEELIPPTLYEKWKASIALSPYADKLLVDLAAEINLTWPTTRLDEKAADFLEVDIASVKDIPSFGRKKSRTLILCIALAAYKADKTGFTSYTPVEQYISFEDLLAADKPTELISEDLWKTWCQSINNSPAALMKIAEMANRLQLDWPYSKREEQFTEYTRLSLRQILNLPGYGNKKNRTLILCFAALIFKPAIIENTCLPDLHEEADQLISVKLGLDEINSFVRYELARLSEREQMVANRRYGINGEASSTLDGIAGEIGVTRERVRQILMGVIEKIKLSAIGIQLPKLISSMDTDGLWGAIANHYGVIYKTDVNRAFERRLHGEFALALDCCEMSVSTWLSSIALEGPHSWYRSTLTPDALVPLLQNLDELIQQTDLPLPLATISQQLGVANQVAGMLICLSTEYRLYKGYAFQGRTGQRPRRTAHLHRLLNLERTFLSLHDLTALHNKEYPKESCTTRDAEIVMREAPNLFVRLGDRGWCSIGNYKVEPPEETAQIEPLNAADEQIDSSEPKEEATVTSILKHILHVHGLANFVDIVNKFMEISGNAYSENSVSPMLTTRDEFVRFAPSVYGLREHLQGFGQSTSDLLLNSVDCQLYAMARYAGEDFESFPLWSPAMEYKWCEWAERRANYELRESLYFIATPDRWPLNHERIKAWKTKISQQVDSYYFLREPKYSESNLPDIRSIYILIRYAKDKGSINWIAANRLLGRRLDDYHTAVDIAFLVCLGVVTSADNWQKLHVVMEDTKELESKLAMMLHFGQGKSWKSQAGELLLNAFTLNIVVSEMGWVDVKAMNKLFHNTSQQNANLIVEKNFYNSNLSVEGAVEVVAFESVESYNLHSVPEHVEGSGDLFVFLDDDDTIILS